jgi:transposase InsO family protein
VSIQRETDEPARSGPTDNTYRLVVCRVGSGPRRSLAEGTRGLHAPAGRHKKFSKWIEVRPLTSIGSEQAVAFFTNIIHRFGIPNSIITNNGTQFTRKKFLDFCEGHHIRVDWATVAHPMTNGQVERANGMILQGLKPRIYNNLNKFGKRWIKELSSMVWSLRTTPSRGHGFLAVFSSLWGRGRPTHGLRIRFPEDKGIRRPKQPDQPRRFTGPAGRGSGRSLTTLGAVSAVFATLPRPKGSAPRLPSGRFGASATTRRLRAPQAYSSLGRAVHHRQNFEARDIQAGQRSRRGLQQSLEHRTTTSLLSLKCFKSFMYLGPFTCINKKSNCQGRIGLASAKTDPPSGARRGEPPLLQNFPRKSFLPK